MGITLNWVNRNTDSEGVRVYRDTAPFAKTALPVPLATVGPGISSYVDDTAVRGTLYYYRFGVFKGASEIVSAQKAIAAIPETGPGPNTPLFGDWDRGFFGYLPATEMFTTTELSSMFGVTVGTVVVDIPVWMKFANKGKILFTPLGAIRYNISWEQLYQLGLVYGVDGPGPNPSPAGSPVNQLKKVIKGDREFVVRLFSGANDPTALMGSASEDTAQSEFSRLLYPSTAGLEVPRDHPAWSDNTNALILTANTSQYGRDNWVQELGTTTATRRSRGGQSKVTGNTSAAPTTLSNYVGWRPVLELVV